MAEMTREEYIDFANALKNNYTIDFDKLPEFCDMAISALSADNTEWVDNGEDDFECHCKKCGQEIFKAQKWFKFCPNCGRKAVKNET